MIEIRLAQNFDIPYLHQHLVRHGAESGNLGDLIFTPIEEPWNKTLENLRDEKKTKWEKSIAEVGWERCWVIVDEFGIYGELKLVQFHPLKSSLHRATLMMGIERSHRSCGYGTKLITEALSWAKEQSLLEWIDLYVFAHNLPAIALYTKAGFIENSTVTDLFRVKGQKIDDVHMILKL